LEIVNLLTNRDDFDFIIFDTPPLLGISDASLISDLVDGIIVIVTLNKVDKSLPQEAFKLISSTRSVKLGIIANSVTTISSRNFLNRGYSNYSYKYGYGYGYADISSYVNDENNTEENLSKVQSAKKKVSDYLKIIKKNIIKLFS